jgi:transaldolase/glucose-6-phosphate isomerase
MTNYADELNHLVSEGQYAQQICDALFVTDIQLATDLFWPVYDRTQGADGYVSLEVNPLLAKNTQQTIDEARQLWSLVRR